MALFGNKTNQPTSPQYLDAIVRGLSYVANCASELSLTHYKGLIEQFFDYDEKEQVFTPKTVDLRLDDNHIITMPLVAVTDAKGLYLDELDVAFSVKVTGIDINELTKTMKENHPHFIVDLAPGTANKNSSNKDIIDFKAKFKANEAPECVMKIIDKYNSQIHPRKAQLPEESTSHDAINTTA